MYILIMIIHFIACFILMGVVLLQSGKGAEMGAAFGGSSQTIFGSRGAATFLSKVTTVAAVLFFITSLSLSVLSRERSVVPSVIDTGTTEKAVSTETKPETKPAETKQEKTATPQEGAATPASPAPSSEKK
ncbi:MAG: preprotein translocase subunit SecG [Candidatus Manganitrophaceae bacterium]